MSYLAAWFLRREAEASVRMSRADDDGQTVSLDEVSEGTDGEQHSDAEGRHD